MTSFAASASVTACGGTVSGSPDGSTEPASTSTIPTLPDGAAPRDGAVLPDGSVLDFAPSGCSVVELTTGLLPTKTSTPFDYVELRRTEQPFGTKPSTTTLAQAGTKCKNAPDAKACEDAIAAATSKVDLFVDTAGGKQIPSATYLVVQSGATVSVVATRAEFLAFVGTIDAPGEAQLLVSIDGYVPLCGPGSVRALSQGGFAVVAKRNTECLNQFFGYLLEVTPAGAVTELRKVDLRVPETGCAIAGRRPEGFTRSVPSEPDPLLAYLAEMGELEAASIPAFERLAQELRAHSAPAELVSRAEAASRDEARHAAGFATLRRARGGIVTAWQTPAGRSATRSLEALATENAVEGCVRETYGALVAAHQAKHAADPAIRALFEAIAEDELRHAELAWDVAEWLDGALSREARARVNMALIDAANELAVSVERGHSSPAVAEACGLPTREVAFHLVSACAREAWAA